MHPAARSSPPTPPTNPPVPQKREPDPGVDHLLLMDFDRGGRFGTVKPLPQRESVLLSEHDPKVRPAPVARGTLHSCTRLWLSTRAAYSTLGCAQPPWGTAQRLEQAAHVMSAPLDCCATHTLRAGGLWLVQG